MLRGHKGQGRKLNGSAHAWRAKKDDVFPVFQKAHGGKLVDLALIDRWLEGEIKVVRVFLMGKPDI